MRRSSNKGNLNGNCEENRDQEELGQEVFGPQVGRQKDDSPQAGQEDDGPQVGREEALSFSRVSKRPEPFRLRGVFFLSSAARYSHRALRPQPCSVVSIQAR